MQANQVQQQQQDSTSMDVKGGGMDAELYKAAKNGSFEAILTMSGKSNWKHQQTPTRNNILHLHVGQPFRKKTCNQKTLDTMVSTEFIQRVLQDDDDESYRLLWKQNSNGDTPLHLAARFGHPTAVLAFLERAKKVSEEEVTKMLKVTNNNKDMALHDAARTGYAQVVKLLVEANPNCCSCYNESNEEGETPLYLAAESGSTPSVLCILTVLQTSNESHLPNQGPCGRTALHAAVQWGDPEMVSEILKKYRLLLRIQNHEGLTPIHCAAAEIYKVPLMKILLDCDKLGEESSAVYIQDNMGRTPVHIAMLRKNIEALKILTESCPDSIEIVDNKGQNVLHYAAKWTCSLTMYWTLKTGDLDRLINDKDVDGNTPLHLLATSIPNTPILDPCVTGLPHLAEHNPSLNLKAFNKQHLTVGDILLSSDSLLRKERLLSGLQGRIVPRGRRINTYEGDVDVEKATIDYRFGEWNTDLLKKAAESRLVVAALIATVSFAAGFTAMPGGFDQNAGKKMGMAVLKDNPSFIAFLVSDTIAFASSMLSIISYFVLVSTDTTWAIQNLSFWGLITNTISLGAMVIAFLSGVTAVLSRSLGLIVPVYAISAAFLYGYFYLIRRTLVIAKYWRNRFHLRNHRIHQ